jgi:hypothetical protein
MLSYAEDWGTESAGGRYVRSTSLETEGGGAMHDWYDAP